MGSPNVPDPIKPPPPADTTKAQLNALAFSEIERQKRATSGRTGAFSILGNQGDKPFLG